MKTLRDIQLRNTVQSAFGIGVSDEFMALLVNKLETVGIRRETIYYAYPYKETKKYPEPHLMVKAVIRVCVNDRTMRRVRLSSTLEVIEQVDEIKRDPPDFYFCDWDDADDPRLEMGDFLDDREPSS